jgi:hypothetical protein
MVRATGTTQFLIATEFLSDGSLRYVSKALNKPFKSITESFSNRWNNNNNNYEKARFSRGIFHNPLEKTILVRG